MADAETQRHTDEAVDALMTLLKYAAWQMAVKDDQIKTLRTLLVQCEKEVGRLTVVVSQAKYESAKAARSMVTSTPADDAALPLSPNGTQLFDAVGKPTNDASGVATRDKGLSLTDRSIPVPPAEGEK